MKVLGSYKHVFWWMFGLTALAMVPQAQAAKASLENCESQAKAVFRKKAVEMELASINGSVSELELTSLRDGLKQRLDYDRQNCLKFAATGRSPIAESSAGAL